MPLVPRVTSSTVHDPNATGSSRLGGPGERSRRGEFATVINYQADRYTATVRTERGRTLSGVPRLRSSPGEIVALTPGAEVLITYDYGMPLILGVLTTPASGNDGSEAMSVSEVNDVGGNGSGTSQITSHGNFRLASEPRDILPGDWVQRGTDGNLFGLLGGGVALMKGSPLAQVRAHLLQDLVEIISRNYRHVTDMGEFTVTNTDGRVNMRFRGASDQLSESGVDEQRWTIKMDLGAEGDLFNFELCTAENQTLFKLHVDSSGGCEIFGVNGVALTSGSRAGGRHTEEHTTDSSRTVTGDRASSTGGDETREISGAATTNVGSDYELSANNDIRIQAFRDGVLSAGRNVRIGAQGDSTAPTGDSLVFDVNAGNWVVNVGTTASPLGGIKMNTVTGAINLKSSLGGDINAETLLGNIKLSAQTVKIPTTLMDSVVLGGEVLVSHLVKFEELQQHLTQLYVALDTHTHPVSGAVASAPTVPIGSPLTGSMQLFKSLKAGVSS